VSRFVVEEAGLVVDTADTEVALQGALLPSGAAAEDYTTLVAAAYPAEVVVDHPFQMLLDTVVVQAAASLTDRWEVLVQPEANFPPFHAYYTDYTWSYPEELAVDSRGILELVADQEPGLPGYILLSDLDNLAVSDPAPFLAVGVAAAAAFDHNHHHTEEA